MALAALSDPSAVAVHTLGRLKRRGSERPEEKIDRSWPSGPVKVLDFHGFQGVNGYDLAGNIRDRPSIIVPSNIIER